MFLRLLGQQNKNTSASCAGGHACPAILEMESGDFAVIGKDITDDAREKLLPGSGCGPGERIVRVPRQTFVNVQSEIPTGI